MRWSWVMVSILCVALLALGIARLRNARSHHKPKLVEPPAHPIEDGDRPNPPRPPPGLMSQAAQGPEVFAPAPAPSSPQPSTQLEFPEDDVEATIVSTEPPSNARNTLDSEVLETAVTAIVPELNRCYREALERDPKLRGDITIDMTVAPQDGSEHGVIEDAAIDAEEFEAPLFEQCLLSAMATLHLPKPASRLYVSYPFTLDPGD